VVTVFRGFDVFGMVQNSMIEPSSSELLDQIMTRLLVSRVKSLQFLDSTESCGYDWWKPHVKVLVSDMFDRWQVLRLRVAAREGLSWEQAGQTGPPPPPPPKVKEEPEEDKESPAGESPDEESPDEESPDEVPDGSDLTAYGIPEATDEEVDEERWIAGLLSPNFGRVNPLGASETDFGDLSVKSRIQVLRCIVEWRMREGDDLGDRLRAEIEADDLRVYPYGPDSEGHEYFYFFQFPLDTRLYRQTKSADPSGLEPPTGFRVVCRSVEEIRELGESMQAKSRPYSDRRLGGQIKSLAGDAQEEWENRVAEIAKMERKESLQTLPRRTSARLVQDRTGRSPEEEGQLKKAVRQSEIEDRMMELVRNEEYNRAGLLEVRAEQRATIRAEIEELRRRRTREQEDARRERERMEIQAYHANLEEEERASLSRAQERARRKILRDKTLAVGELRKDLDAAQQEQEQELAKDAPDAKVLGALRERIYALRIAATVAELEEACLRDLSQEEIDAKGYDFLDEEAIERTLFADMERQATEQIEEEDLIAQVDDDEERSFVPAVGEETLSGGVMQPAGFIVFPIEPRPFVIVGRSREEPSMRFMLRRVYTPWRRKSREALAEAARATVVSGREAAARLGYAPDPPEQVARAFAPPPQPALPQPAVARPPMNAVARAASAPRVVTGIPSDVTTWRVDNVPVTTVLMNSFCNKPLGNGPYIALQPLAHGPKVLVSLSLTHPSVQAELHKIVTAAAQSRMPPPLLPVSAAPYHVIQHAFELSRKSYTDYMMEIASRFSSATAPLVQVPHHGMPVQALLPRPVGPPVHLESAAPSDPRAQDRRH
jgi:hypothetical protein